MRRTYLVGLLLVLLSIGLVAGSPLIVAASENPDFDVYLPENIVEPGEETAIELEIRNGASAEDDTEVGDTPPGDARDVTVDVSTADDDIPVSVQTETTPMPTMSSQMLLSESFDIVVDENASAGSYELEVEIDYTYTTSGGSERTSTDTETVEIVVDDRARFDADLIKSELIVGDRGTVQLELTNTGVENASDAVVQFGAADQNLQTVTPTTEESELSTGTEEYIGDWEINETVTATANMELADDAVARTYPVTAAVEFRDEEGVDQTSRELRVGAPTKDQQSFALENVSSDLAVGEDGTVKGELTNKGPNPVDGAVIVVDDSGGNDIVPDLDDSLGSGSNVYPREGQYAVGQLEPGESAPFEFRIGVGSEAEPGPRVIETDVRYRNAADEVRTTTEPLDATVDVAPERDEFALEALNATFERDSGGDVELTVTNQLDETVTDIEAKLFTNDPLDSSDDEAFIPALESGESATVVFDVSVEDSAMAQTYPLRLDFRYDDARSNSQLTDTYRVPIDVVEPKDDGLSTQALLAILGVVGGVGAAVWWFRDRLATAVEGVPVLGRLAAITIPNPLARLRGSEAESGDDSAVETRFSEPDDGSERGSVSDGTGSTPDDTDVLDDRTAAQKEAEPDPAETDH
ncbi:uncharacterized protein Nmag_0690 [Natrialba magadii ATCC 43099]|uniref:CARDB domain-containing protein n=1 Tax=Natrialba magadii (strain ATCC 43099 / DSM 3394 / CCM 3739 / CIP 104546 / IAM 13178 / JCM 8861 / NBRC 102185 / NCIMB 2190 / MS3) TaxID=547559 RepID=D3SZE1_NATMM|nr:COG1361 S-layer family protein [Natrialba magadii]ADD04275.1 uncharacterized protein Nmag_0690 [Natrialba magadii ATCC 43099]ELY26677.1 hypothetical protein C500_15990 [Natrialba magadii ATCC 43099]